MRRLVLLAVAAAACGSFATPVSAACPHAAKLPAVWTPYGLSSGGPYVEACGFTCAPLVSTPALSVPGVVAVGSAYVNNCS